MSDSTPPPHSLDRASTAEAAGRAILQISELKAGVEARLAVSEVKLEARLAVSTGKLEARLAVSEGKLEARLAVSEGKLAGSEQLVSVLVEQKFAALQGLTIALVADVEAQAASALSRLNSLVRESAAKLVAGEAMAAAAEASIEKKLACAEASIEKKLASAEASI